MRIVSKVSDLRVVLTSLTVSVLDVTLNVIVAIITGSTVMMSQALQGASDLITGATLFIGVSRSKRLSDENFQFGYGREIFFWVLIAGIIMFAGTGVTSLIIGYREFIAPNGIEHVWVALVMLLFGLSTNGYAFSLSVNRLRQQHPQSSWLKQLMSSSIIETKATFIIDFLGTLSALIGLLAIGLYASTGYGQLDGIGSMCIGIAMMISAAVLLKDVRDLIVGKAVDKKTSNEIIKAAKAVVGVKDVLDLRTMYLGSSRLLVILEVHIADNHDTHTIERITDEIKDSVKRFVPLAHHVQVEIETPDDY